MTPPTTFNCPDTPSVLIVAVPPRITRSFTAIDPLTIIACAVTPLYKFISALNVGITKRLNVATVDPMFVTVIIGYLRSPGILVTDSPLIITVSAVTVALLASTTSITPSTLTNIRFAVTSTIDQSFSVVRITFPPPNVPPTSNADCGFDIPIPTGPPVNIPDTVFTFVVGLTYIPVNTPFVSNTNPLPSIFIPTATTPAPVKSPNVVNTADVATNSTPVIFRDTRVPVVLKLTVSIVNAAVNVSGLKNDRLNSSCAAGAVVPTPTSPPLVTTNPPLLPLTLSVFGTTPPVAFIVVAFTCPGTHNPLLGAVEPPSTTPRLSPTINPAPLLLYTPNVSAPLPSPFTTNRDTPIFTELPTPTDPLFDTISKSLIALFIVLCTTKSPRPFVVATVAIYKSANPLTGIFGLVTITTFPLVCFPLMNTAGRIFPVISTPDRFVTLFLTVLANCTINPAAESFTFNTLLNLSPVFPSFTDIALIVVAAPALLAPTSKSTAYIVPPLTDIVGICVVVFNIDFPLIRTMELSVPTLNIPILFTVTTSIYASDTNRFDVLKYPIRFPDPTNVSLIFAVTPIWELT